MPPDEEIRKEHLLQSIGEAFAVEIGPDKWYDLEGKREIVEVSVPTEFIEKFNETFSTMSENLRKDLISLIILSLTVTGIATLSSVYLDGEIEEIIQNLDKESIHIIRMKM